MASTNNSLYPRRYRVFVAASSGAAFEVSELRCTFKIERTMNAQPNLCEVSIFNLTPELQNTIIAQNDRVIVEAGYEGPQYGVIFDGQILQTLSERENQVDFKLTLVGLDGANFMSAGMICGSYAAGATRRQIVQDSISKVTAPAQTGNISPEFGNNGLSRGKVMFGLAGDYYRQMAQTDGALMYIDDGKVNLIRASDLPPGEVVNLTPTSGLIGTPSQTQYGVNAKSLLNPRLKINSLVRISSEYVQQARAQIGQYNRPLDSNGLYRIIKVTHTGDTRGQNWYTDIETISQSGGFPAMIGTANAQPWY
ncbi:hypothetical protein DWV16_17240 [Anaerotruncus sp. AF02-27]|uniref:phage protein n=1 Tax=Anaerotruncus TaxID=244127 RepID=UPI000E50D18D|nr:hypothetical protein [Anaerotruncus sp. AF02-27]RGX53195.1 hypothetical protein DWV16_17240 [Anaerotruncus sp. AF02-27]